MNIETKLTLVGAGSVLLLDTIASFLSIHFSFSYALCCLATLAVYFGLAYWGARHLNLRGTLAFGAFLGLVDATAGWKLSDWLGADPSLRLQRITFSAWCMTVVFVMILGAVMALVAFLIVAQRKKRKSR